MVNSRRIVRVGRAALVIWILALLAPATLTVAEERRSFRESLTRLERDTAVARLSRPSGKSALPRSRTARHDLTTRLSFHMESLSAMDQMHQTMGLGGELGDQVLADEMSRAVERGVRRATRRAIRDFVLEATDIERRIMGWGPAMKLDSALSGSGRKKRLDFDFGIHSFLPDVAMRYRVRHGALKFSVDAGGRLGIRYNDERLGRMEIRAGFDGDDEFRLNCKLGF